MLSAWWWRLVARLHPRSQWGGDGLRHDSAGDHDRGFMARRNGALRSPDLAVRAAREQRRKDAYRHVTEACGDRAARVCVGEAPPSP